MGVLTTNEFFHGPWTSKTQRDIDEARMNVARFSPLHASNGEPHHSDCVYNQAVWDLYAGVIHKVPHFLWIVATDPERQGGLIIYTGNNTLSETGKHQAILDAVMQGHCKTRYAWRVSSPLTRSLRTHFAGRGANKNLEAALGEVEGNSKNLHVGDRAYATLRDLYREVREPRGLPVPEGSRA